MLPAVTPSSFHRGRTPVTRRAVTLTLTIVVHLLLLGLLLRLAPPLSPPPQQERVPTVFDLKADGERPRASKTPAERERRPRPAAGETQPRPTPPTPAERRPTPAVDESVWSKVLPLSRNELAQADIAGIAPAQPAGSAELADAGGAAGGDSRPVGRAPNGETLYNADWYREPTNAELSPYLPRSGMRAGWGMVACRTATDYRVEDCVEIGQDPPGSGLSRAVRQAAWQFRVRAPRLGGKPLIGTWVRIRIEYTQRAAG